MSVLYKLHCKDACFFQEMWLAPHVCVCGGVWLGCGSTVAAVVGDVLQHCRPYAAAARRPSRRRRPSRCRRRPSHCAHRGALQRQRARCSAQGCACAGTPSLTLGPTLPMLQIECFRDSLQHIKNIFRIATMVLNTLQICEIGKVNVPPRMTLSNLAGCFVRSQSTSQSTRI